MQIDLSPPDKALLGKEGLHPVVERVGVHMEGGHMVLPGESLREGEQRGGHPLPLDGRVHRQAVAGIDLSPVLPGDGGVLRTLAAVETGRAQDRSRLRTCRIELSPVNISRIEGAGGIVRAPLGIADGVHVRHGTPDQ